MPTMTNAELAAYLETLPEHDCAWDHDYDDPREVHCAGCEEWVVSPEYARLAAIGAAKIEEDEANRQRLRSAAAVALLDLGALVGHVDTYWRDDHQLRDVREALAAVERADEALTIYESENPVFAGLPEGFWDFAYNASEVAKDAARQSP
jgi:hypothetical protein